MPVRNLPQASVHMEAKASVLHPHEQLHHSGKTEREEDDGKEHDDALLAIVDHPDIRFEDKVLISNVLKWLPPFCRDALQHVVVQYDAGAHRGLATSSTIFMRGVDMSASEKIGVLVHECSHIGDLGWLQGSKEARESPFPDGATPTYMDDPSVEFYSLSWKSSTMRKPGQTKADFASGYALHDPWEDLAETFTAYVIDKHALLERAQKSDVLVAKVAWIEKYFISDDFRLPQSGVKGDRDIWDWTKEEHTIAEVL